MRRSRPQLAARRRSRGLTQEQLAYAVGVDRSTVARWEAGETEPQPWVRRQLQRALAVTPDGLEALLAVRVDTGGAGSSVVDGSSSSLVDVEKRLHVLAVRYRSEPSTALLMSAGHCQALIGQLLTSARTDRERLRIHRVAAVSCTLSSQLVWDASGRRDTIGAVALCEQAIGHAEACEDATAAAHAQLRRTYVALYGVVGRRDPVVGLATAEAVAGATRATSTVLYGLARLHAAEALAMMGEYRRCEHSLADAETAFEHVSDEDPAWEAYAPGQLGRLAGSCYLALGLPERAEPILARTAEGVREREKTRSLVLGNLALSYLRQRQRQLDAAAATLHEAIDLCETSRGSGGLSVVFGAVRELSPWRELSVVQDVQGRLLGLIARN